MASIEEQLVVTSKQVAEIVVANIGKNQDLFDETMELVYRDESPISMRAAWVANFVVEKHSFLVKPHIEKLAKILPQAKVDGVKRLALKMLMDSIYELPEDIFGELADTCFTFAEDPNQAIAVRAFSLDILLKVLETYPEIKPELIAVMESMMPDGSRGLKNKCYKTIKKLKGMSR
jgi:hypothetical protein